MSFQNVIGFSHDSAHPLGVLLINLGTPDAPTTTAVRRYLTEFLADPRVIEGPRFIWWLVLHGFILRVRPARSAKAYQAVWTEHGSPLLTISQRQAVALQQRLEARLTGSVHVELGMRYGNPSISSALHKLRDASIRRLLILPLYPQYSGTTTGSTFDAVTRALATWRWLPEVRFINQYHDEPAYIAALVESVRAYWAEHGEPQRLLFSFHGIPKDYFLNGDPYHCQCHKTARLVSEGLGLPRERWQLSFQSRVGNKEWLKPYTDETLRSWGAAGIESTHVLCPGFAADCLETIEEIGEENRQYFLKAGGKTYGYIPCLNDEKAHMEMLADLVHRHSLGWPESAGQWEPVVAEGAA
ncbi:ferrochelatase [Thioflavicoccus mobilis 8321]|uniref:Ferrochelatase n=1 Tax=Thioflavicoccus mobilis 8321 TaxID=765912 RepID=L0GXQ4_9GAMM|nr:ferrochelatase [Thioflavicoccus mobilis]AGA90607.1 ferrochelatase [Thioflavicoccus mobilis 8321]